MRSARPIACAGRSLLPAGCAADIQVAAVVFEEASNQWIRDAFGDDAEHRLLKVSELIRYGCRSSAAVLEPPRGLTSALFQLREIIDLASGHVHQAVDHGDSNCQPS